MAEQSDEILVQRALQGEVAAYGLLVRRYQQRVFNVCYRVLGNVQEAEDLAQESFIRAYDKLHLYNPERPFGPWISRVATNLCLNHLKRGRATLLPLDESPVEPAAPRAASPEAQQLQRERAAQLHQAIQRLTPTQRAVVELRHFQELSYQQIASALEISLSQVKSHLYRARRALAHWILPDE